MYACVLGSILSHVCVPYFDEYKLRLKLSCTLTNTFFRGVLCRTAMGCLPRFMLMGGLFLYMLADADARRLKVEDPDATSEAANPSSSQRATGKATRFDPSIEAAVFPIGAQQAFVHLAEWSWEDVAVECEQWLGPHRFAAVLVSPPNDHIQGHGASARYQPITYNLTSNSGYIGEFVSMVQRCTNAGVGVYVTLVFNHIAAGAGRSIAGCRYGDRVTPIFSQEDFHHDEEALGTNCQITLKDNTTKRNMQFCDVNGLPDLCTGCKRVQEIIVGHMHHLLNLGVAGFHVHKASFIDESELSTILERTRQRGRFVSLQVEQNPPADSVTPNLYFSLEPGAHVTEFKYLNQVKQHMQLGQLHWLKLLGEGWGLVPRENAVVFLDYFDTNRYSNSLSYNTGRLFVLANVFMLAFPYGYPMVGSSFFVRPPGDVPPMDAVHGDDGSISCGVGKGWVCEHRLTAIANMVKWRAIAGQSQATDVSTLGPNTLAFCRGQAACVVMNRGTKAWEGQVPVSVPPGDYCNIIGSDTVESCSLVEVRPHGALAQASVRVPAVSAVAFHIGACNLLPTSSTLPPSPPTASTTSMTSSSSSN